MIIYLDCEKELNNDFKEYLGYKNTENKNFEELFIEYLNLRNKKLFDIKNINKIYFSKELFQNKKYKKFKEIIHNIENEFKNNINFIKKRLSYKANIPYFKDFLLNNWDIYHLHLCTDMPECKNRKNELLFVKFYQDNVYFLDIKNHRSFASKDFIKIIHNNWPEIIKNYKIENVIDIQPKIKKEEDIFSFWKNGINIFIPIYDKNLKKEVFYTPLSLGINIQGYRIQNVMDLISFRKECDNIKEYLKKYKEEIHQFILKQTNIKFNILKFVIKIDFDTHLFYLLERNSNLKFGWNEKDIALITNRKNK
jgi:hypothetical protein